MWAGWRGSSRGGESGRFPPPLCPDKRFAFAVRGSGRGMHMPHRRQPVARRLRRNATDAERRLWNGIRREQIAGFRISASVWRRREPRRRGAVKRLRRSFAPLQPLRGDCASSAWRFAWRVLLLSVAASTAASRSKRTRADSANGAPRPSLSLVQNQSSQCENRAPPAFISARNMRLAGPIQARRRRWRSEKGFLKMRNYARVGF
jgi:hypothetical protein